MATNTPIIPTTSGPAMPATTPLPASVPACDVIPLPQALRDSVLAPEDLETLLRTARDKQAASGRYARTPRQIPVSE
jgi:hypothetical protein